MFLIKLTGILIGLAVVGGGIKLYREIEKIEATMASVECGECTEAEDPDDEELIP